MAKTWVLQTETKGTGANVVPLDSLTRRSSAPEPVTVPRKPKRAEPKPREPRAPRRFRIVDVTTRAQLADDVGAAAAIEALKSVRSMVDVDVYLWQPERLRWRLLGLGEQQAMFELATASGTNGGAQETSAGSQRQDAAPPAS